MSLNASTFEIATFGNVSQLRTVSSPGLPWVWPLRILPAVTEEGPIPSPIYRMTFLAWFSLFFMFRRCLMALKAKSFQNFGAANRKQNVDVTVA